MMDYYSQYPAPNLEAAKREVIATGKVKDYSWSWTEQEYLNQLISEAFELSGVLDDDNEIKFSFSGWHTFGKNDVLESIDKILIERKKLKLRRKFKGLVRTTYLLIKLHKETIEKMYHPNSQYVNTVIKNNFKKNINK